MNYDYEQQKIDQGYRYICGIDEAGRGSLAGPLVAAAVILKPKPVDFFDSVKDSKVLSEKKRSALLDAIIREAVTWSIGLATHGELDKHGLAFANKIAMKRAWQNLYVKPDFIATDYIAKISFETPFEAIVDGDNKVISIAAASIVAKVFRDRMMEAFGRKYPDYGFEQHKGYGTKFHRDQLNNLGPCDIHRKTFGPVKAKLFQVEGG
jgi:ribonuclease HII